jgi:hypothetical protein
MALTPRLHSVLPPQYHRSAQQSLLGRSYAYDRGAGTVTFPEQYGVRIGKGAMPTALWSAARLNARLAFVLCSQLRGTHRAVAQCTHSSPRSISFVGLLSSCRHTVPVRDHAAALADAPDDADVPRMVSSAGTTILLGAAV